MSTYRDDLGAAVARADALQRELDDARRRNRADQVKIGELERLLGIAQRELLHGSGFQPRRVVIQEGVRLQPFAAVVAAIFATGALAALALFALRERTGEPMITVVEGNHPQTGHLAVASEPPGATVEVDGIATGTTPLVVELAPGSHEVAVRSGGRVQRQHVQLGARVALAIDFETLGGDEVREAMSAALPDLRACGVDGRVDLHLVIGGDGEVGSVVAEVEEGAGWASLDLAKRRCLERIAAGVQFPPTPRPTHVIYPLELRSRARR